MEDVLEGLHYLLHNYSVNTTLTFFFVKFIKKLIFVLSLNFSSKVLKQFSVFDQEHNAEFFKFITYKKVKNKKNKVQSNKSMKTIF